MRLKKQHILIIMLIIMICTPSCAKEEKIIVNIPTLEPTQDSIDSELENDLLPTEIPVNEEDKIKISNSLASIYVKFIDSDNTYFLEQIDNNPIDTWYNNNYIENDSTRVIIEKNKEYYNMWQAEALTTYTSLSAKLSEDDKNILSNQYKDFFNYLACTKQLYNVFVNNQNEYNNVISKELKLATSYAYVNCVRKYTIELKELYYLLTGEIHFNLDKYISNTENDNEVNDITISTINNIEFELIRSDIVRDILLDNYLNTIEKYKDISGNNQTKSNNAEEYKNLWNKKMVLAYNECYSIFKEQEKNLLFKQQYEFEKYVYNTKLIAKAVFNESKIYKTIVDNKTEPDLNVLEGNYYMEYFFELLEYMYVIDKKIDI